MYEAHLTYAEEFGPQVEQRCPPGWKFSTIAGDPVLGKARYCYLTSHGKFARTLLLRARVAELVLGLPCLRLKIEKIVYDTKTGIDEVGLRDTSSLGGMNTQRCEGVPARRRKKSRANRRSR